MFFNKNLDKIQNYSKNLKDLFFYSKTVVNNLELTQRKKKDPDPNKTFPRPATL